jgi:RecA-family ATPase
MPGVTRNGKKQFLVDMNIGKQSWEEWHEWIESINDDLPEPERLEDVWDQLPQLSAPLIGNLLRQGHKMLISGPSKAGKSFALIELSIAIAEGVKWLGWECTRGKVLYVNLELDRASCLHRFRDVYEALGLNPGHLDNIDIWNLRGKAVPMDKLAPKLIRRAVKKNYIAVIIDPIYKVITGDENSADQMANFCNQFDKVCTELNAAVIYCHHHSKGSQGGKRAMDRASGSGVFARDPDAILDLIELDVTEELLKQETNKYICDACAAYLNGLYEDWEDDVSQDDLCSQVQMMTYCKKKLFKKQYEELNERVRLAEQQARARTAWRIEGTLREFPKFEPVNVWFNYPVHCIDRVGVLKDIQPEAEKAPWQKAIGKRKTPADKKKERKQAIETAYEACGINENVTVEDLAEYMAVTEKTVRNRLKEHGGFVIEEGNVRKKT